MKVFLSWSGAASREVAELLRRYLPCMLQEVTPFMSQHDLGSGVRWADVIARELEDASFGITCLTPENLGAPWILFEAGALTKHVRDRACCLLLQGLKATDVTGPLAQFQNRTFSEDEMHALLSDINRLLPRKLEPGNLDLVFTKWWPDLDRDVRAALESAQLPPSTNAKRDPSELLEELLLRVREMQSAIDRSSPRQNQPRIGQALSSAIEATLAEMPLAQRILLSEFAAPPEPIRLNAQELENRYGKDVIEALIAEGILSTDGTNVTAHHVIVDYLRHNFE